MEKKQPTADCIVARLVPSWGSRVSLLFKATEPYEHYYDENGDEVSYGAIESWTDVELPPEPESEDEKIRKWMIAQLSAIKYTESAKEIDPVGYEMATKALAWFEKQKEILQERAQNITTNMLEDRIEGIQRELIEFLSNTINASWVDIIKSADFYAERIKNIIEKQKEQKPAEWSEEDEKWFDYFERLLEFGYNKDPHDLGKLCVEGKMWLKSLHPQPKQEWQIKEGDKVIIHCRKDRKEGIIAIFDSKVGKVIHVWDAKKNPWGHIVVSLDNGCNDGFYEDELEVINKPHWKPSEEQMEALRTAIIKARYGEDGLTPRIARVLESLNNDLMNI